MSTPNDFFPNDTFPGGPEDPEQDWRAKPKSLPRMITVEQRERLYLITQFARQHWRELRELEEAAYRITQEEDKTGYTSDLVLQSDVDIDVVLKMLEITVEETKP